MNKKIISSFLLSTCIISSMSVCATDTEPKIETNFDDISIDGGSCTLSFDSNGGTECSNVTLGVGTAPRDYELPTPLKAGHTFLGWFTEDGTEITKSNPYDAFEIVVSGTTSTVYAKWEKQEPTEVSSSICREPIENSEEYYELIATVENFADGSKIAKETKTRKIEDYAIESFSTINYYNIDGTITSEGIGVYYGYEEYKKNKAINSFEVTVTDIKGNPVEGVVINFKTDEEDINFTTDENGEISHKFNKSLKYTSSVVYIPNGYVLNQEPEKLGLGCMYSVIYTESYILDLVSTDEPITPSDEIDDTTTDTKTDTTTDTKTNTKTNTTTDTKTDTTTDTKTDVVTDTKTDTTTNTTKNAVTNNVETKTVKDSNVKELKEETIVVVQEEKSDATVNTNEKIIEAPQTSDNNNLILYLTLFLTNLFIFLKLKKED